MALIKVNTDKSGASALELTAHYKMTIYWGWQSVKPLHSNNIHTGHYSVTNSLTADNQFAKCSIQCFPLI